MNGGIPKLPGRTRVLISWTADGRQYVKELSGMLALLQWRALNMNLALCELRYWGFDTSNVVERVSYEQGSVTGCDDGDRVFLVAEGAHIISRMLKALAVRKEMLAGRRPAPSPALERRWRKNGGRYALAA